MKKYVKFLLGLLVAGWWSASCSSDHDDIPSGVSGKGGVRIGLSTETGFSSRAVDESEYKNLDIYTVQILKDDVPLADYKTTTYKDLANKVLLLNGGSYTVKAFYGEDKAVSTTSMYVEGGTDFIVKNDTAEVSFACKPVCAKVIVDFDTELMDKYFSDYYVVFKSKAMGETAYTWDKSHKADTPVYMKVEKEEAVSAIIYLTAKDGVKAEATISKSYTLSPLQVKTITIAPALSEGSIGIEITIDEGTNDKYVDITVPSEWV